MNLRKRGFTLIELLVVIAIIGILSSAVLAALNTSRAKGRYALVIQQMDEIKKAADLSFANGYASDTGQGILPPSFSGQLSAWPTPPCPGWTYDWENWSSGGRIYITIRNTSLASVAYYCIEDTVSDCGPTANGANIKTNWPSKAFTCNE